MNRKILSLLLGTLSIFLFCNFAALAAIPPASQQIGGQERSRQLQEESQQLQQQVEEPKQAAKAPQNTRVEIPENPKAPKVLVKHIDVEGVTVFPADKINAIVLPYENKELGFSEIQKIAFLITDLYRKKGYITSRAYVPPQQMKDGILIIKVIEAKMGDFQIKGNRYFSSKLIGGYVTLQKGQIFNYNGLKEDLQSMNQNPDRAVRAVLAPGVQPGSSDVILNVKDELPVHVSFSYDNYLSYYLRRNEYTTTFTDNNLLGRDDILTAQYTRGDGNDYYYYSGRYVYPVTPLLNMGVLYSRSNEVLGRSLAIIDSAGESKMYGVFGDQKLLKNDNLDLDLTFGFDYKDVDNYLLGELTSRDDLRIPKAGLNLNMADDYGRTVISDEVDYGIPGIMGGDPQDLGPNDIPTSRSGAGGKFFLDTLNLLRLQQLPLDSTLLWKNQFQFSSSMLTTTEQFQAGGPANNRGFEPADAVGDQGYAMSWELSFPAYFVPRYYQFPYFHTSFYDAFRFIGFYDWTNTHLNEILPGEEKNDTLSSAGCGIKLSLANNFFASYEVGWPIQGSSADGKRVHQWISFTATF